MKAIEIKMNHWALSELCFALEIQSFVSSVPEQQVIISIMSELSKKLDRKEIEKRGSIKKFKITLKYYEAYALEKFCRELHHGFAETVYFRNVALDIANQIHKQL